MLNLLTNYTYNDPVPCPWGGLSPRWNHWNTNSEKRIFQHHWIFFIGSFPSGENSSAFVCFASQLQRCWKLPGLSPPWPTCLKEPMGGFTLLLHGFPCLEFHSPLPSRGLLNAQQHADLKAEVQAPWCYTRGYILTHSSLFPTPPCKITKLMCNLFFGCSDLLQSLGFWKAPRWCWLEKILLERHLRPRAAVPVPRVSPVPQSTGQCPSPPAEEI